MKILFILQYIPYPLDSGGNQATFSMIDAIRKKHEVSLIFHLKHNAERKAMNALKKEWDNVTFYAYRNLCSQESRPHSIYFRLLNAINRTTNRKIQRRIRKNSQKNSGAYKNKKPIALEEDFVRENSLLNHELPFFPTEFQNFVWSISRKGFDIIQIEFYECLQLVYLLPPEPKKIFIQHEIRFVRNKNELDLFLDKHPSDEFRYQFLKDMELKALSHYNKIVALTEVDKQVMLKEDKNLNIYVSPAIVSTQNFLPAAEEPTSELVYIGGGFHFPNADGIMWFCKEIDPLLKKAGCNPTINIVGNWNKEIQEKLLKIKPNLHFTGFVDDLGAYINGKISIIPLRIGSGMRMKILDSISSGSPIITTSKGYEGLPLTPNECMIVDSPEEFATAIIELLANKELQKQLVNNAQQKFSNIFNFEEMRSKRLALYKLDSYE